MSLRFARWWRLGLASTEAVLAAGLIVTAVTEGGWYWWASAIAAATLALINLSVYVLTRRERLTEPEPPGRPFVSVRGVRLWCDSDHAVQGWPVTFAPRDDTAAQTLCPIRRWWLRQWLSGKMSAVGSVGV